MLTSDSLNWYRRTSNQWLIELVKLKARERCVMGENEVINYILEIMFTNFLRS